MKTNLEIEFKTFITKEKYEELLADFNLENNIFEQTNHYFDTDNLDLVDEKIVLRIRQKGNFYKLTSKSHSEKGAFETHMLLDEDEALEMLEKGFDANRININHQVHKVSELTTFRVSTPYKNGIVFFDKSVYYGHVDYEIEYEVDSFEQGQLDFQSFLQEYDIPFVPSIRKSYRAYSELKKNYEKKNK